MWAKEVLCELEEEDQTAQTATCTREGSEQSAEGGDKDGTCTGRKKRKGREGNLGDADLRTQVNAFHRHIPRDRVPADAAR